MSELKMPYLSEYEKSCIDKSGGYWIPSNNCPDYVRRELEPKLRIINEIHSQEGIRKRWGAHNEQSPQIWGAKK